MLYQIGDYVTPHSLNMLHYSFVYSSLNYGIIVWGTATQNQLHEVNVRMNNIVRSITWNKKFSHVTHLHKKLNYLKLNDIYCLEPAKFMHKICNNKLPLLFQQRFNKIELVHSHQTTKLTKMNYFLPRVSKTAGKKKLEFRGAKLWNEINEDIKHKTFNSLKKCFKEKIVSHY